MSAKKRTKKHRERDLPRIAEWDCEGVPRAEMARRLSLTRQQIEYDLEDLHNRWLDASVAKSGESIAKRKAEIDLPRIAEWDCEGVPRAEMARRLSLTRQQIEYDLEDLHNRWLDASVAKSGESIAKRKAEIEPYRVSWESFRRS